MRIYDHPVGYERWVIRMGVLYMTLCETQKRSIWTEGLPSVVTRQPVAFARRAVGWVRDHIWHPVACVANGGMGPFSETTPSCPAAELPRRDEYHWLRANQ